MERSPQFEPEDSAEQLSKPQPDSILGLPISESLKIFKLVDGWEKEWKIVLQKPYAHRSIPMKSGTIIGNILTREINFKSNYRLDNRTEQIFGKTYPSNLIVSQYPFTIEYDFCLHLIEEAKLVQPSNDEQVSLFIDSIDSSIRSAINVILTNDSNAINSEQYHIWNLMKIALHEILNEYFASEINELNAYSRLVRPSEAPPDQDLLRPAGLGSNSKTDELVRPSDDPNKSTTDDI